ncbi:MAG: hypothetical protein M1540_05885 [Candidatus Bathyarchaeota archaeon]|nr:hypothetical protein [Candidatus Bathyarchaeota archaeon]
MIANDAANKLPEELRENYKGHARKGSAVIESLKVAAALKLWCDRGYREMGFEVSSDLGGKTFHIDVVARDEKGMVGVECINSPHLGWLRWRVAQLRRSLPEGSYLVVIFPFGLDERHIDRAVELVDEVWVTGEDGRVERMMCMSVFHKG